MKLYISFTDWTPLVGKNWLVAYRYWNGLDNYLEVVTNLRLWQSIDEHCLSWASVYRSSCCSAWALPSLYRRVQGQTALLFGDADADDGGAFGRRLHVFMLFRAVVRLTALSALSGNKVAIAWLSREVFGLDCGDGCRHLAMDAANVPHSACWPFGRAGRSDADGDAS